MTVTHNALDRVDRHWAVTSVGADRRDRAEELARLRLLRSAVGGQLRIDLIDGVDDAALLERLATAYELAAIEGLDALLYQTSSDSETLRDQAQAGAFRAYELRRALQVPVNDEPRIFNVLHLSALAYCGDRWADVRRWLRENQAATAIPAVDGASWDRRLLFRLFDCWVRLFRKNGWSDLNAVRGIVAELRNEQQEYEAPLLDTDQAATAQALAFRLIALYHWARATELLATYTLQGEPAPIEPELNQHFEAALAAATASGDSPLEVLLRWLHVAARRMVANSLWRVAQAVPRTAKFVEGMTKSRGLFELLPPQRAALQEQGLLDEAKRAIVIDMPTSAGKTILAQFRMLQALNQFDADRGWVAYVAPTRALVSQLTRRLRVDFEPLDLKVEQLTAAVEIDGFEEALLEDNDSSVPFHVLVATPEKLDLVVRNKKIARPMALLVMDEAQNIEDEERGLRIELLLATVKRDCPSASFLLLVPHATNASDLAQWLAGEESETIRLGTSPWQPNERIVGTYFIHPETPASNWSLQFESLTSTVKAIHLQGSHRVGENRPIAEPTSNVRSNLTKQTAAIAKVFSSRGTSIAVARTIRDTWNMARTVASNLEPLTPVPEDIQLVQRFLATEISPQFELINLLSRGVAVHHSGLSDEARSLVEWLAETGLLRVLCATTGIAQGINFPVSSVFLASRYLPTRPAREMPIRSFWNLAGRAGRLDQDSVGVVGLAAGNDQAAVARYVATATDNLVSQLVKLLDEVEKAGEINNLSVVIQREQWADFRSYVAHMWNEKKNLEAMLADTELLLRNTFGYGLLQSNTEVSARTKARALLEATRTYARALSEHPTNAALADSTGFSPEGVRDALLGLGYLDRNLKLADWKPDSLFGPSSGSMLPELVGVMMRIPELKQLAEIGSGHSSGQKRIADVIRAWVTGRSVEDIARDYFDAFEGNEPQLTNALTETCKMIYRVLVNSGTWGLSALSRMPTSGIPFEQLSDEERQAINNLPARIYHGVFSEAAIVLRMNSVPRTVAEPLGVQFQSALGSNEMRQAPRLARQFLRTLSDDDWQRAAPEGATMSGADYRQVWSRLSGERV